MIISRSKWKVDQVLFSKFIEF